MKRLTALVSGEVQGVGFRAWAKRQAEELGLSGYAMNKEDGTVEVVCEGDSEHITEYESVLRQGPDAAWIEDVEVSIEEGREEFDDFEIR